MAGRETILWVDATPDDDYVLRILQAYRANCDCRFADSTDGSGPRSPIMRQLNADQEKRAKMLDAAIAQLPTPTEAEEPR